MFKLDDTWRQVCGDMDPARYGAVIAKLDGDAIEMREIQPVREYIGDSEAAEVGHPYWSKEGWYDPSDLAIVREDVIAALRCCDVQDASNPLEVALACLRYGHQTNEGPAGWAKDVVPQSVVWWHSEEPSGPESFEDDEDEFRREILGEEPEDDEEE